MRSLYYDKSGSPIDQSQWIQLMNPDHQRVALDKFRESEISTVWLGLDHGDGMGAPMIFETLVFGGELDGDGERYATLEQAVAGHALWVERVRAGR